MKAIDLKENLKTNTHKSQNKLMKIFKENLIDKGLVLLNKEDTFIKGEYSSSLDIIMSNKINRITNTKMIKNLPSDHHAVKKNES